MKKLAFSKKTGEIKVPGVVGLGPVSVILVVLLTYFLSQIFAVIIISYSATLIGYDAESAINNIESSTFLQFAYIAIVEAITLYVLWWFMRLRKVPLKAIGLVRKPNIKDVGPALIVFAIYFVVLILATALIKNFIPGLDVEQEQQIGFKEAISPFQLGLVFVSLVILAPVTEEIMVRGFMYAGLRARFTKISSAIIASVIFGIAHLQLGSGAPPLWIAALDTAILSMFLIYLREKTGALWAGMFVHGLKNGIAFFVLFIIR